MSEPTFVDTSLGTLVRIEHGWPFESAYFREQLTGRPIVVAVGNFQYTGGFRFASTTVKEYAGEYPRQFELKPGDILLVMTCQTPGGEILGIPARIPDDGRLYLHNQRLGKVVLKRPDLADLDYLYYVFLSRDFNDELVASSTGTKIVHTAPSRIEAFRFRLPPLDVQRSIASLLKALDEKIESNRTINVAVETLAAGLFRSWLVDFEPVIAKRDGQRPVGVPAEAIDLFASSPNLARSRRAGVQAPSARR
jgi:type I restriction enzyme S subunit